MPVIKEKIDLIDSKQIGFKGSNLNLGTKENIHLACFSETYKSILMWSHYANNYKGFCVEYNFKELGLNNAVTRFYFSYHLYRHIF